MEPELVMTKNETKEMKESASKSQNGKVSYTKYRQRIKNLGKTKDITNVELNPDAIEFSDISTETYLDIPNNANTSTPQENTSSTITSAQCSEVNASEIIQENSSENIFDGDSILNDLNQVELESNSIVVELPNDLEDINENDIILLVTE